MGVKQSSSPDADAKKLGDRRDSQMDRNNKKVKTNPEKEKESEEASVLTVKKKNNHDFDDYQLIDNVILKHFFMKTLDKDSRKEVIKEMSLCFVKSDTIVFKQGNPGNYFYIIKEGKVDLSINDKLIKSIGPGESFGELALIRSSPRSGTIKATKDTYFWCLQRRAFRKIINFINQLNFEENKKFIQTIPILSNIENDQKIALCSNLIKESYDKGALIVKENDIANCLYIIKDGEVDCGSKGKVVRTLKKGDIFGENSILVDSLRTMDVIAKTNCILYSISIETLKMMSGERYREDLFLSLIKLSFSKSIYFNKISSAMIESVYSSFKVRNVSKAQSIIKKGEVKSSKIFALVSGNAVDSGTSEIIAERGTILFDKDVYNGSTEKLKFDIIADPDCLLCECNVEVFHKQLGGNFQDICEKSDLIGSLQKVPLFRNFPLKKLEVLSQTVKIEKFPAGSSIIVQGEMSTKFYILRSGKIDIFVSNNYIRTLNVNEYFGERALFFNEARSATAKAKENVEVYVLDKDDFKKNIESNLKDYLINRFYLQDNTVELKDLEYIKELGSGNFGAVSLVQSKKTQYFYAIKSISKKQIDHEQLHKNLDLERSILLQIDHPFIVKLVKTLKDSKFIYFLMEHIKGKELFDTIRDIGLLNKAQTNFYCCSMMLAVEYLHERKFIYRDLKPENIIVTEKGFIKLIDFGTAKIITDRASTIIGTPHYMAPEVILGEGYTFNVDFWSIAICMYEFICGGVPFGETAEDPMDVYLAIINDSLNFPNFVKDKEFKNLMSLMLNKNPIQRLYKLQLIKNHSWFNSFKWDDLITMNLEPPYIPKLSKENFTPSKTYVNYVKTIKEWVGTKEVTFDLNTLQEYEKWHNDF